MRRILFIAYLYPPIANSGTRRSLSFANRLPDEGWEPVVLTVADPAPKVCDEALIGEIRPGTRIERVPLGSLVLARSVASWLVPAASRQRWTDALVWRFESLAQVPDQTASWYFSAVRRGIELHRQRPFDAIYASGWPWTSFLVARAIGRVTGCPYVLDYRDLWKPTGTHEWETQTMPQKVLNPLLERRAARGAAALVSVTGSLVGMIERELDLGPVDCITNGFEPADFVGHEDVASRQPGVRRISYTGVWRPGYGLEDLYRAVRLLKDRRSACVHRLRVDAAGFEPGPASEFGVDDLVHELGPVPHDQALTLMRNADALYLSVPKGFYASASLPGKLFEYLGSGTPILAVAPAASEVARVIDDVGGALRIAPGEPEQLAEVIEAICAQGTSDMFLPRRPDRLRRYTREATTRQLAAVFERVASRHTRDRPAT
jgi:glycosyltransferase involved in cell wall biosynthesis